MDQIQSCLLLGLNDRPDAEASMFELERLADTAGLTVAGVLLQNRDTPDPATYIGSGKTVEMREFLRNNGVELVIVNGELSAGQIRTLEDRLDAAVIDRTMLILDIFAGRARSSEGRLQVELAQLNYRLPRLAGLGKSLSRLGGGIGTRGPGETKLETDRRHIRRRIRTLEQELEKVKKQRATTARGRLRNGLSAAALVGYTNAGKSTLMNRLCGSNVYVRDQLFATLDPTVRRIRDLPGREILLVDTVGFLRDLPHALIDAFRSTLEESLNADLLLLVADASDSQAELQISVVRKLLHELRADQKQIFLVLNKTDRCDGDLTLLSASAVQEGIRVFPVSAETGAGCGALKQAILRFFSGEGEETVIIPYEDGKRLALLYRERTVLSRTDTPEGICLKVCRKSDP